MADIHKSATRPATSQVIAKHIANTRDVPVVSNVRCVRLYRRKYGFGLNFKYLYRSMEERENRRYENLEEDDDDVSGSDADASGESSDTSSSKDEDDTVDKAFIKWVAPGGSADQAGLMKGDEVISLNNSAVYGKHASDIDNVVQRSNAIDVDVIEDPAKRKGKVFQRFRGNGYEVHVVHRTSQDELSDNGSSENDATTTGDRFFVVSYGKASGSETTNNKPRIHSFLRPTSYSDDEPQMENKSVCISVGEHETKSEDATGRTQSNRYLQVNNQVGSSDKRNKIFGKRFGLTTSTCSSVLVESQDNGPTPNIPTCVTITTATLAEPQSARTDVGSGRSENVITSCSNGLLVSEEDGNVWELRVPQASHIRPRSPSPAQRRVSYLMATEGDASLTSGNWEFKSIADGDTDDGHLSPFEEENNVFQSENEMSKEQHRTVLHIPRGDSVEDDEDDDNEHIEPEVLNEENRHSLKRKCSVGSVEVDKEGYLKRKYGTTHGRRSWKQVYVVLKAHIMYISKGKPDQMIQGGQDEKPVSIKSCIVDIAYDYRKRENVFKLTTYSASVYLFQAKDKDDMMSWIEIIQKNNNPDEDTLGRTSEELIVRWKKNMDLEISSQTSTKTMPPTSLKMGGLKKSLSFKINSGSQGSFKIKKAIDGDSGKAATWHSKVVNKVRRIGNTTSSPVPQYQAQGFSAVASLEHCPKSKTNPSLPLLVEHCCQVVENRALESVGIYRVPGNSAMVTALEEDLIKTPDGIDFEDPKWNDANNMASLLRNFLRKLPEGLVTSELYAKFINANRIEGDDRMWSLKRLIQQLPSAYGETLRFIIGHLKKVSEHSDKNKMEVRNLAIVFGPTIVRTGEDNMTTMVNDMTDRFRIVESFINHCDWFFDNEPFSDADPSSPVSPPAEAFSPLLVSSKAMNSIEQAAVNYDSDPPWKSKGGSIKLPTFKNFLRTQSSESSRSSESSKKYDVSPDLATSPEPVDNGKGSPVNLSPNAIRFGGSSQPSSPSASRRKFIKRHHSSTNISTTEVHDDFDRSKSEGEEEEYTFHPRQSHSTKAYSYARPPPPSYRESRNKVNLRAPPASNAPQPSNKDANVVPESADFNSLSDGTKLRLLNFTLRSKVNEKKKQNEVSSPVTTQNEIIVNSQKDLVTVTVPRKLSNSSQGASSTSEEHVVVTEPQLKPSEAKQRFEQCSDDTKSANQSSSVKPFSRDAVRRRDGSTSSSSSRNFKIYSKGDVTFSHCQPNQINEWMRDLGLSPRGGSERGRARAKTEDLSKTMKRSSSVSRTSFTQDDEEIIMKRRSLSCQDINIGDEDVINRTRTLSKSSDSTESSDEEEEDPLDASSKAFDEKLRGLMQKCKLDSRSKTDLQPGRKTSQVSRPPSYRVSRTSVEKMRAVDPGSNIQSGAVSSIKSLFESGVAHQNIVKSRSSSLSSASSCSLLSNDTPRKTSTTVPVSDADVKRRVWESDAGTGQAKRQWKEPEWVARERAMKNLHSGSEASIKEQPDDNNNLPRENKMESSLSSSKPNYSRSTSLPIRDSGYVVKDVTVEQKRPGAKTQVGRKHPDTYNTKTFVGSPTIQRAAVKNGPTIRKITPASSVQYKPQTKDQSGSVANKNTSHKSLGRTQSSPFQSTISSQESVPPASPPAVNLTTNGSPARSSNSSTIPSSNSSTAPSSNSSTAPSSPVPSSNSSTAPASPQKQKSSARSRRRIVSDTTHRASPESRQTGRTFTTPKLGTIVTTTTAFELAAFAIKPESTNRTPKARCVRRSEKQENGGSHDGQTRTSFDMHTSSVNLPRTSLTIPNSSSPSGYGSPSLRRKAPGLTVPDMDESKRLSTDRTLLEQNALHIKELLDEMNTEHSLKMERQKSDTISMNAQKAARHKARMRRRSLGQDRDNGVVVASRVSPTGVLNERNRSDTQPPRSTTSDLPRNLSTVEWVGVSS